MNAKGLACAYADAVLNCIETGDDQAFMVQDGSCLLARRDDCEGSPHIWVNLKNWHQVVGALPVTTDPADADFDASRLRAEIVQQLLLSGRASRLVRSMQVLQQAHIEFTAAATEADGDAASIETLPYWQASPGARATAHARTAARSER